MRKALPVAILVAVIAAMFAVRNCRGGEVEYVQDTPAVVVDTVPADTAASMQKKEKKKKPAGKSTAPRQRDFLDERL